MSQYYIFWFQKMNGTLNPLTLVQCTFLQSEKATSTYIQPVGSGGVPKNNRLTYLATFGPMQESVAAPETWPQSLGLERRPDSQVALNECSSQH